MNTINTNMRNAFVKATVKRYSEVVSSCLRTKSGTKPVGRGWTANLSPSTTKQLIHQGVFA